MAKSKQTKKRDSAPNRMLKRKNDSIFLGLTVSLAIHALLAGALLIAHMGGSGNGGSGDEAKEQAKEEGKTDKDESEIIPKEKKAPLQVEIVENESGLTKKKPKPKHADDKCPDFFGGIGVQYSNIEPGLVINVPSGYPAEDAGIRAGDRIIAPQLGQIRGEVGTEITVTYISSDGDHTVTMVRDKICIDKKTERAFP